MDDSQLQYGAWLRGEPSRRGGYEVLKPVLRAPPNGNVDSSGGTEQVVATTQAPELQTEISRTYVEKPTGRGDTPSASEESKHGFSDQEEGVLHENGKECEGVEKKHEKIAQSSESVSASSRNHGDKSAFMHWERAPFP